LPASRAKQLLSGTGIGLVLIAHLFLFLPLILYVGNHKEFSVPFNAILPQFFGSALILLACIALASVLLPLRISKYFLCVLATISLLVWLQGNLLVWEYGLLNGTSIDWNELQKFGWLELAIWTSAVTLAIVKIDKAGDSIIGIAMTLGVLQFCLFCYQVIGNTDEIEKSIDTQAEVSAKENIFQFSQTKNIVHIIADGFQADIIDEILSNKEYGREFSESLSGFTFFRKQLGVFPYTHMTVPALLSGKIYQNDLPISDFMASALGDESIIGLAKKNGYQIDMALQRGALMDIYNHAQPHHMYPLDSNDLTVDALAKLDARRLMDLSLFRATPHVIKKRIYNDQNWFIQSMGTVTEKQNMQNFSHMEFLQESASKLTTNRDKPVYKLFHLMLSHNPMITTADCQYAGNVLPTRRENVINQSRCSLQSIISFLEAMKKSGIYDSSTIVVMGDHGAWVPPSDLKPLSPSKDNSPKSEINPAIVALATPFFAIKRPDDDGPIEYSYSPTSIRDTAVTIASINKFPNNFPGVSVFDLADDQDRDRPFMFYRYKKSEWTDNHLSPIEEFTISGDPADGKSWTRIKTHEPDNILKSAEVY